MNEMTDDEVFGKASSTPVEMSDDDVFGTPKGQSAQAVPPSAAPEPVPQPIKGKVPLPRERPLRADVAETQDMPPVIPMDEQPFRTPGTGEVGGSTEGMMKGTAAYEERFGRPAREAVSGVPGLKDVPAQTAIKGSVQAAQDSLEEAKATYADALERQKSAPKEPKGEMRESAIDAEVNAARYEVERAQRAFSKAERTAPPTFEPKKSAALGAAASTLTGIVDPIGGVFRPVDEALGGAGVKGGTGVADTMQRVSERITQMNPTDPTRQGEWGQMIGSGAGSLVPFAVTGAVGRIGAGVGALGSRVIAGVTGAAQEAEQFYREAVAEEEKAKQFGGEPPPAWKKGLAYLMGAAIGSTEAFGLGGASGRVGKTRGGLKHFGKEVGGEIAEESLQEGGQQTAENVAKEKLYGTDPGEYGIFTGAGQAAAVGGILGAGVGGLVHAPSLVTGGRAGGGAVPVPSGETVTPEDIAAQVAAGGIQVHDPNAIGPPLPTNEPVTTVEGGVKTTTTLHGPAPAYTVTAKPGEAARLEPTPEKIVTAAIQSGGQIYTGAVHTDAIESAAKALGVDPETIMADEAKWDLGGFVTNLGRYVTREEAQDIAERNDQIDKTLPGYAPGKRLAAETIKTEEDPRFYTEAQKRLDAVNARPQTADRESTPVTGMYSRLRAWVQEKGPSRLPANEWLAKLTNNNAFTKEEVQDLQLPTYLTGLMSGGTRPTLSKQEMLDYIDTMTAPLVEVTRAPLSETEIATHTAALESQIREIAAANPSVTSAGGGVNLNHPLVAPIVDQIVNLRSDANWAQYEKYTTPGPRTSYTELTMHLPSRGEEMVRKPSISGWESAGGEDLYDRPDYIGAHYTTPNEIVTIRLTVRETADGQKVAVFEEGQSDMLQALKKGAELPFDPPYKEGWPALGFTRFLMWATQQGITRVAWANSAEHMRRYPGGTVDQVAARRRGMEHFYDKIIPSIAKKWARNLGGTITTTIIPDIAYEVRPVEPVVLEGGVALPQWGVFQEGGTRVLATGGDLVYMNEMAQRNTSHSTLPTMILPQSAIETIQRGVPSYAAREDLVTYDNVGMSAEPGVSQMSVSAAEPLVKALDSLIRRMRLGVNVKIVLHPRVIRFQVPDPDNPGKKKWSVRPKALGTLQMTGWTGVDTLTDGVIHISVAKHVNAAQMWATMVHELGHIFFYSIYQKASTSVRIAVEAAYAAYKARVTKPGTTLGQLYQQQSNAVSVMTESLTTNTTPVDALTPKDHAYWTGFDEFFAEMVAKWATSDIKPLSEVEKFFKGVANKIIDYLAAASKMFGMQFTAIPELTAFLNSFLEADMQMGPAVATATAQQTVKANAAQMLPEETAVPAQVEVLGAAGGINGAFDGRPPKEAQEAKAYADKFSWLRKMFYAIHHLATANPHIQRLQDYVEVIRVAKMTKDAIMIRAQEVLKAWNALGGKQADAVSQLLDAVQNMVYRTPAEVAAKVARNPTMAELQTLVKQFGVTQAGLAVFADVGRSFQEFLNRVEAVLRADANKITDQTLRDLKHAKIDKQMAAYRSKPYFPAMRFGSYTITVRNAAGTVIHFETFETKARRDRAFRVIQSQLAPGDKPQAGYLNKDVRPLLGVPGPILEMLKEKLALKGIQIDALEQLQFELSPAQSFKHQFQHKRQVAGYSTDFQRVYANYFWHGANHLMKTMHADTLRALTKMVKEEVAGEIDITKREKIVAFMADHTDNWLDPKAEWPGIQSLAFMWHLAWSPVAAAQNMTQTMLTSFPHLASKFGPGSAAAALGRAGRSFQTFYTKGKLAAQTNFEQQALFQGMEHGVIKETQAPELAGYADGNVLSKGWGGNNIQRYMTKFAEMGAFMFEMAEQVNRRLVFRAALQLALDNPNAKYVRDTVKKRNLLYQEVRGNMTEAQAAAYVTAYDSTVTTQFQYGKEFSPRVLRGKQRAFLVFQSFKLNYVLFLLQNKHAAMYSLLVMSALGGLMGVPGSEDAKDYLRLLGWQLFGTDFKLDREIRKYIIELLGKDGNGADIADLILHGASRKGFGIPAALNMIAGTAGIDFTMPTFDRSKAISLGTLLPVELSKLFGPPLQSSEKTIAEQGAKASGAIFGVGFALYSALRDQQLDWNDAKRWERAMPRAIASVSKAYRAYTDEGMRSRSGAERIKYDPRDNLGMAEIIGIGMGYTPYRQSLESEKGMSRLDAVKVWDIRREGLMRQFGSAALAHDQAEKSRVLEGIRTFNKTLPPEARGKAITTESLQKSVEGKAEKRVMEEKGLSTKKSDIPIMRAEDKLYPESQRTTRKVPRGLTP
jgi:hypothetical protein